MAKPSHNDVRIVDNGSSTADRPRSTDSPSNTQRDHGAHPGARAWLNQIEIYSIVQRKVLSPNDFTNIDAVSDRLSAFENQYNQTAQPFKWKFTTTDLIRTAGQARQPQTRAQSRPRPTPCRVIPTNLRASPLSLSPVGWPGSY